MNWNLAVEFIQRGLITHDAKPTHLLHPLEEKHAKQNDVWGWSWRTGKWRCPSSIWHQGAEARLWSRWSLWSTKLFFQLLALSKFERWWGNPWFIHKMLFVCKLHSWVVMVVGQAVDFLFCFWFEVMPSRQPQRFRLVSVLVTRRHMLSTNLSPRIGWQIFF